MTTTERASHFSVFKDHWNPPSVRIPSAKLSADATVWRTRSTVTVSSELALSPVTKLGLPKLGRNDYRLPQQIRHTNARIHRVAL